jgi:catechol 2,3-dioxygenase-like lactoylglutathione lyase family enzyme
MASFDHVHLFCTDLDAMVDFWVKAFGAEFVKYRKFGAADGAVVTLGGTPIFLKVVPADAAQPDGSARGLNHIGIRVEDPVAMGERLEKEFGGRIVNKASDDCVFASIPDGLTFELMRVGADI